MKLTSEQLLEFSRTFESVSGEWVLGEQDKDGLFHRHSAGDDIINEMLAAFGGPAPFEEVDDELLARLYPPGDDE